MDALHDICHLLGKGVFGCNIKQFECMTCGARIVIVFGRQGEYVRQLVDIGDASAALGGVEACIHD